MQRFACDVRNIIMKDNHTKKNKTAIVLLAEGFELVEAMTVVDYLRRVDVEVTTVTIGAEWVRSQSDVEVRADRLFAPNLVLPDAVIVPGGGQGAKNLAAHPGVLDLLQRAYANGAIVAAICAGPTVLEAAGLLSGRTGTSYPGFEGQLSYRSYVTDRAYTDGNMITSRGPSTAIDFAEHLVRALVSDAAWEALAKDLLTDC